MSVKYETVSQIIADRDRLRAELAQVNNEFGSETADWPEAWRRVSDLKDRGRILWQEVEALRADAERYRKFRAASMDERNRLEHYAGVSLDEQLDALSGGEEG